MRDVFFNTSNKTPKFRRLLWSTMLNTAVICAAGTSKDQFHALDHSTTDCVKRLNKHLFVRSQVRTIPALLSCMVKSRNEQGKGMQRRKELNERGPCFVHQIHSTLLAALFQRAFTAMCSLWICAQFRHHEEIAPSGWFRAFLSSECSISATSLLPLQLLSCVNIEFSIPRHMCRTRAPQMCVRGKRLRIIDLYVGGLLAFDA